MAVDTAFPKEITELERFLMDFLTHISQVIFELILSGLKPQKLFSSSCLLPKLANPIHFDDFRHGKHLPRPTFPK